MDGHHGIRTASNLDSIIAGVVDEIHGVVAPLRDVEAQAMLAWMEGLLTAAAIGPERTRPDEWLQALPTDLSAGPSGMGEALLSILGLRYNQILTAIKREGDTYEPRFFEDAADDEMIPLAKEFAAGFHRGMHIRSGSWVPMNKDRGAISDFAPIGYLLIERRETEKQVAKHAELQDRTLPYIGAGIWHLYKFWQRQTRRTPAPVNPLAKLGRNAHCPCGSGKKFKRCCMN